MQWHWRRPFSLPMTSRQPFDDSHLAFQWPHMATAKTTGNISFTAMHLSVHNPFHSHWIHFCRQQAPQSYLPEASVTKVTCGDQFATTFLIVPRPFLASMKHWHHARSHLNSRFWWTQWSKCLALWTVSSMRLKKMCPAQQSLLHGLVCQLVITIPSFYQPS